MSKTIGTNTDLILQPAIKSFDPQKGETQGEVYRGANAAAAATKYNHYKNLGYVTDLNVDGVIYTVTAQLPDPEEIPFPTYELGANKFEKSVLISDSYYLQGLTEVNKRAIEEYLKRPEDFKEEIPIKAGSDYVLAKQLWILMKDGLKNTIGFQPILKKSYTCSPNYNLTDTITAVGQVHQTQTVWAVEQVPFNYRALMPTSSRVSKTFIETKAKTNVIKYNETLFFNWGWLKNYPIISQVAYNKIQVSIEYHYGMWAELVYGSAI